MTRTLACIGVLALLSVAYSVPKAYAAQPGGTKMDVGEIVKLLQSGVGEDVVIEKLKKDGKTYDLSADDLIGLKKAGATNMILRVMMNPSVATQPQVASSGTPGADLPDEQGVYVRTHGQWTAIDPQVVNSRTANMLGHAFSYGISKAKLKGDVEGAKSKLQIPSPVEILIKCAEGTSASEYQVLRMEEKGDRREFEAMQIGFASAKTGARKGLIEVKFEKIGKATVRGGEKRHHFRRNRAVPVEPVWRAHWRGSVGTLHQLLNLP